jgi:hypothetical protein
MCHQEKRSLNRKDGKDAKVYKGLSMSRKLGDDLSSLRALRLRGEIGSFGRAADQ